jgi:AraC family transcriptional regulator
MAAHKIRPFEAPGDALRSLAATLLAEPDRLVDALTHEVDGPFYVAPHTHEDLLQLDLVTACSGTAWIDGKRYALAETSALATYPGQQHGYELLPARGAARVYLVKIRVDVACPLIARRTLPELTSALASQDALADAMQAVIRMYALPNKPITLMLARLAEALALWPRGDEPAGAYSEHPPEDPQLARAVHLIETRPADPPSVEELAEAANLSPRHFARRFKQAFHATPHQMITARRLEAARQLLLGRRLKVHQVAEQLGFSSVAAFSRWFSNAADVSPARYQTDPSIL